jgi:hypothetical protein
MIFEMKLIEFSNPLNKTYSNKFCSNALKSKELSQKYQRNNYNFNAAATARSSLLLNNDCETGFLFCLVDLPFRNPQNCSLGDFTTPVLGGNQIFFTPNATQNYTYKFTIKKLPSVLIHYFII